MTGAHQPPRPIAYYITAHGYGHGVRSCDIVRAYHRRHPETPFILVTDLPEPFLRNRLPGVSFQVRPQVLDVGMVQLDSVRVDVEQTLTQAVALLERRADLVQAERAFMARENVGLVVADIPSIPFEAAAKERAPSVAVGNFSWNWIYSSFEHRDARWRDVMRFFEEGYAQAGVLLRLPFAEEMSAFPHRIDVPVVAEPGCACRDRLAALTGAPSDTRWILLSFSTLAWTDEALDRVEALDGYSFFTVRPLAWPRRNLFSVDREHLSFSDILASVDAVVTKPGFGVLSECVVNHKPMVYVDRTDFLEYPVLEAALTRCLQHAHIPAAELYRGALGEALEAVFRAPPPRESVPAGGGPMVAAQLHERYVA